MDEEQGRGNVKVETPVLARRPSTLTVTLTSALNVSCDYSFISFQCSLCVSVQSPLGLTGEAGVTAARPVKEAQGIDVDSVRMAITARAPILQ